MPASTPNCKLQHCDWHVSQNIAKRLAKKGYLKEWRKEIMDHVWWYIQSETEADLVDNRVAMMERLRYLSKITIRRDTVIYRFTYTHLDVSDPYFWFRPEYPSALGHDCQAEPREKASSKLL